jgi:hypothetical protein
MDCHRHKFRTKIFGLIGRSLEAVRDAYLALEVEASKRGLKINEQKIKFIIATGNRTIFDAGQTVAFSDRNFEVLNDFVYLGTLVTPKNDVDLEIQQRIKLQTSKLTIYNTLIHPVLLYGSKTWILTKMEDNQLIVFERKVLCTIYGAKTVESVYKSRYNFEFNSEFNSPNVIGVVNDKRCQKAITESSV